MKSLKCPTICPAYDGRTVHLPVGRFNRGFLFRRSTMYTHRNAYYLLYTIRNTNVLRRRRRGPRNKAPKPLQGLYVSIFIIANVCLVSLHVLESTRQSEYENNSGCSWSLTPSLHELDVEILVMHRVRFTTSVSPLFSLSSVRCTHTMYNVDGQCPGRLCSVLSHVYGVHGRKFIDLWPTGTRCTYEPALGVLLLGTAPIWSFFQWIYKPNLIFVGPGSAYRAWHVMWGPLTFGD